MMKDTMKNMMKNMMKTVTTTTMNNTTTFKSNRYFMQLFVVLSCAVAISPAVHAQDAQALVQRVKSVLTKAKDYRVETTITPKIPMINVQPIQATLYFKQKDKFRFVTPGIAVLPKQGFSDVSRLLMNTEAFSAITTGKEKLKAGECVVVTLLPNEDTMDVVVAKIWVDPGSAVVHRARITTKSSGTVGIDYTYGDQIAYGLPKQVVFTVDMKKFKIPKGVATDLNRKNKDAKDKDDKKPIASGSITVDFKDYKVNKGVDDAVFSK